MHTCILKILNILYVFDLMCVPSVMQRKCKASKMAGAGLLQSPLPVMEDGSETLQL
jgi:hypothetical protein